MTIVIEYGNNNLKNLRLCNSDSIQADHFGADNFFVSCPIKLLKAQSKLPSLFGNWF